MWGNEIGPVTITTDPKKFQFELRELYVQGGGDCPEMSIGAIKIALEISLPGSFIYVFTDARSKDYRLAHEVLQLIQQKQSQVVFVLTGDCDDRDHIGYKVYEEIASTSSGQVFHLDKKQVNEVLKWVEEAVQASKVHLLSTDHLTMAVNTWQIPFDPSLKEVTVSLSGPSPAIEIHDPLGEVDYTFFCDSKKSKQISKGSGLNELLNIHNSAKVVNVKDPEPGMWTIKTSSSGRHSVRITGLSTIDFRAGFSRKPTLDFKKTSSRPVQGIPTFVLLNTTGIFLPARVDQLELLSITGELLKTLPVKYYPDRKPYGLWNISDFVPPDEAFFVKIMGYDKDDYLFQRVSSVSFSSITPDVPKVTMPTKTPGYYLQPGSVPCHVESLIPFTQRFTKNGVKLGVDQFFKESSSMSWEIAKVSLSDEGFYECMASSSAGTGRAQTFLDVSEPPPMIQVPNNVTVVPGEGAILTCLTLSTVHYNLTWQRNGRDVRLKDPLRIRIMSNLSLEVKTVKLTDAGKYNCIASNEGGSTTASVFLTVQEPPRVVISPKNQTFTEGSEVSIRCSATGYPKPTVVWTHNDMFIIGSSRYRLTPEGTLIIRKAIPKDAGIYGCLASNSAGTEKQTSTLIYIGDLELRASAFLSIDTHRGLLKIQETQDLDAGDYTCVATNDAGRASGKITLDVGSPPVFTQEPSDESADIGSNITLPCYVQGLWVSDEGTYICEAENQFGRIQSRPATITVTGLVTPLIGVSPAAANVIEGQQLTLPCVLLAGNPIPDRRWIKNNMVLVPNPYINVRSDGSLHLERVRLQDGGDYTCMASNVAGTSNKTTTVNVYVLPVIQHGQQIFSTIEGIPVTLPCKASGVPKPSIVWSKKGEVILSSNVKFSAGSDGSLYVVSPGGEETGEYVCTATNAAGYATRKVQLTVYVKPRVSRPGDQQGNAYDKPIEISVIAGEDVTLPCEVKSLPPPIITWAKEMQLISPFSPRHTFLPSGSMEISETQVSDSGIYICVATNIAGNATQSVKLSVHVPPKIQRGPRVLKVQAGHRVDIPCSAQGIPPPTITWFKGRSIVPIDGGEFIHSLDGALSISNIQLPDAGIYKCVASNIAGSDTLEITVQVQESPTIDDLDPPYNSPFQERVANQRIAFPCPAKGIPKPVIKWLRNGREVTGSEPGISILDDGTLLIIASVTPSDNGEYICVATNEAGSTERKYNLKVYVPPEIRDQEKVTNTSVVVHHPVSLFCEVSGNPFPIISWYKEDIQVVESSTLQILHNGKILKLLKAATDDAGQYSCKAINIAGSSEKLFNLDILVPPSIIGADTPGEIAVILNQEISLECRAEGFPFPDVHWFKDGKPLFLGDPNVELLDKDQVLHIKSARRIDKGRYQCSATNTAGKQVKEVRLIVHVPPSIKGGNITTEVSALLNNLINLECETKGIPVPTITWYKDGRPIISSPRALYVDRGQFLQIPRAQVSDSAKYTCHVTNAAGAAEKIYDLDVYVPPVIEGDADTAQNRQVVAGNSLTLECKAAGNPPPLLTWLKDGVPVKSSDNLLVVSGGKKLEILNAVEAHRGQYLCVATSIAGEQEIRYEVEILVPPFVEGGDELLDYIVILHSPLELDCSATGTPSPTIMWLKDGQPVEEGAGHKILLNGQKLLISRAQVSDTGRYKCMAANKAGEHEREFDVTVHVPPAIKSAGTSERAVVIYKPVMLQCIANGIPSPSITWLKDGQPVNTARGNIRLESSGRILQVVKALLEDAGRYTCVATNAAGEAQQHVQLHVHEPPSLEDAGKMLNETVVVNNPIHLECRVSGNPLPAITWYKDNRPLTSAASATFLNRGQVLQIEGAQISDTGVYKCVAVNTAGTAELFYSLQVHGFAAVLWAVGPVQLTLLTVVSLKLSDCLFPPSISGSSDMVTVVVNNLVRLECEARGIPAPILTWLKDGSPVSSFSNGLQVLSGGRVLALASAQISDTGKYICVAVNAAGESQRDIDLRVYVPPNIMGEEQNVSVLISQAVELLCQSNAIPPPVLMWLKDGRPLLKKPGLSISEDGSVLKIEGAQVQDTGRYTCEATNVAGKTEKNYNVNIWVSPSIYGSDDISQLTVIEGSLISLICESSGIPPPSLTWKKNGSPLVADLSGRVRILSGGRQLQISVAEQSDAASYTCIASNVAGSAKKEHSLQVYIRPTILDSGSHPSEVVVTQGNEISLECKVQGIPEPAITWMKDGRLLVNGKDIAILHDGHFLQLKSAQVSDTGRYVCVAANVAGLSDRKYDLNVHVPPSIAGDLQMPENISIVEKNPISLVCEASGIPLPSITWLKNGWPVTLNNSVRILSGGRTLRLTHTSVADEGQYTCVVTNAAGEVRKDFDLSVLVPPGIVGETKPEDVKVKEKHRVSLTCEVIGNPVPHITWIKDGQPLTEDEDHKFLSSGRFLQITNAQVTDTGRYTCIASNTAGDKSKSYTLNVLVSPTIVSADGHGNAEDVTVILNSPTSLVCEAYSYPPATITWLKDGNPLESNRNIRILPGGRTLQILNAQEDNAGRYTCIATNEAGETLKHYEMKVYIPPTINKGDISGMGLSPKEVKIKVNHSLTLECEAHAIPAAAISCGHTLQIKEAQVSDTGRYTCLASNIAGEDEVEFDVNVQVPPSFQKPYKEWEAGNTVDTGRGGESKDVIVNSPLSLYCETNAVPPPVLTWYKDGYPLSSSDKVLILPVPPSISGADGDLPEEVTVLVNKVAVMDCVASGSPSPSITWQKDGHLLAEDEKHVFLSNGRRLQILNSQITDTGRYICIVENIAGSAKKYFNLNVHVPPSVVGTNPENLTVVVNNFISLTCEVTGFPPPDLSWLKNGKPITSNTNTLIVPVPPSIKDHSGTSLTVLNVRVGTPVMLECESNAIPPPVITWYKNRRIISESANVEILADDQTLRIKGAEVSDTGQYVCKAINIAGRDDKNFHLNVYVPPNIEGPEQESVNETIGNPVTFGCDATGIPPPTLVWLKNGKPIENSDSLEVHILSGGSKLQIAHSQLLDSGTYTCIASNIEGKAQKSYVLSIQVPPNIVGSEMPSEVSVLLGESIQLVCNANGVPTPVMQWLKDGKTVAVPPTIANNKDEPEDLTALSDTFLSIECTAAGTPPPQINWLKNGLPLSVSSQIRLLSAGQILRLARVQISDSGVYTCVASNRAGVDSKHYNLQVFVRPSLDNAGGTEDVTVVKGSSASMKCLTDGTPAPTMSWFKNGHPLSLGTHLTSSNEGMVLHFVKAAIGDTGKYTCVASNEAGDTSKHFSLEVLEPPYINGSDQPEELSVIVNNPLELLCISSGIPVPKISWMKDGRPLLQNDNVHVLREVLRITSAQVEDTGRYTCLASSPAGDDDKEYLVRVHVPPNIAGTSDPQDFTVLQNRQVILECKSDAVPPPTISWLKNGELLEGTPRVRILSNGRYLQINNADLSDTASYTCVASNIAGKMTREFMLTVHVAPMIRSSPQTAVVHINASVVLECVAEGVPTPRITWRKDGAIFSGNNMRLLSSGSLVIISPTVDDTAVYECSVSNDAGEDQRAVELTVQGAVEILAAQLAHAGRYTCVARNAAGSAYRHITLHVQQPPVIQPQPGVLDVIVNNPILLPCEAMGTPQPIITWQKEGINIITTGNSYMVLPSGSLQIANSTVEDAGTYMCVAQNPAGTALGKIKLKVQVPPVIKSHLKEYVVPVDQSVTLQCEAEGYPGPGISWHKDGQQITESIRRRILSTGALQIVFVQPGDAGHYTCIAANLAGSSSSSMELIVHIPPQIRSTEAQYTVTEDSQAVLSCVADGIPTPTINWKKDNTLLTEIVGKYRTVPDGGLILDNVVPEDSGSYTCIANNAAGEDTHTVTLIVHVLPAFTELPGDVALTKGEQLRLTCKATGIPAPKITWTFNNNIIPAQYDDVKGHSELVIERVSKDDSGTYVCTAENTVGSIKAIGFVYVKEPPVFKGDYHSSRIEPLGGNAMLNCEVRGDPPPTIQWRKKGVGVPISNRIQQLNNGSLAIYGTVNEDAGDYKCVATNDAGVVERSLTLTLQSPPVITVEPVETVIEAGATAMLNCQANGEPPPTIRWSRQGHPVASDERMTVLSNGSLRIVAAQKEDTSEYECVARNLMGSVLVRVPLTVQVDGNWSEWGLWEECSKSCGQGNKTRTRTCSNPPTQHGGKPCDGSAVDSVMCNIRPCPGGPSRAKGSIIGNINDIEFGIAFLNATVTDSPDSETRVVQAKITNIPRSLGPVMRKLVSILSPVYWTTAKEIGEAMNGFTLTDAVFKRETQVEFATGEILRMTHIARGLDSDGALLLDVVVSGHVLQLQSVADVNVKDYTEDYIQTGPGQLYAHSTRLFSIDGVSVPYTWNHTITYDYAKGKMPFLVETLHASSVMTEYNPLEETVAFKIHTSIAKGDRSNQCPAGFGLDSTGPYCSDEDECAVRNPCSHTCHNAMGSYYCSCPKGLTISADGRTCQDIDECALGGHTCHAGQDCENIIGSYRCVVRCGNGFRRTADGFSCQDIDECRDGTHQCRYNQICENTRGSYRCVCPRGYRSQGVGRPCVDIDECETRDTCQHECRNTLGSYQCTCPSGYRLTPNGKTCQDIDECLEQNINCGSNQMCFNMRGSYQCIDTPCPPNYQREPLSGFCLKNCPANDLECDLSTYALEYKLLSLPFGIAAGQDLIRLVAYTHDQVIHPRTTFLMADEDPAIPFALRDENLKGVVFTTRPLQEPKTYRMGVRALSYSVDGNIEYRTTFIVYIAVSAYPY
ncbi:hypothetical protein QYF61_025563 [Mycteria americana]|uniref:Hemicentin-1 n=1 Tax=Mycteria americana TaxID=33587 RepID=A0AAN7N9D1_MYCAM|nr:hypothetical protein QYF61_025563 [Mycteria americana]